MIGVGEVLVGYIWRLVPLAGLLVCSGFFSASETALFNLSRGELYRMGQSGRAGRLAAGLMRSPRRLLNTLLLANMLVNVAFSAIVAVMVLGVRAEGAPAWMAWAGSLAGLLALIFIGEVCPKALALAYGRRWSLVAAPILRVVQRVLGPVLWAFESVLVFPLMRMVAPAPAGRPDISADELDALLDLSAKQGVIDRDVNSLLQEIFDLREIRVSKIMVPRVDMIACDINAPRAGLVESFTRTRLRRMPVYDGDVDNIVGVVPARRVLLSPQTPMRELVSPPTYVPEAANIERVLLLLRTKRTQMAIVVDEYGGTAGLVTMEDVLEEIVGDIPDPRGADRGPLVRRTGTHEYLIDADLAIHEWTEAFKTDLESREISTIGGFVLLQLGRMAAVGDTVTWRNLLFTVVSMRGRRGRRIGTLRLQLLEHSP